MGGTQLTNRTGVVPPCRSATASRLSIPIRDYESLLDDRQSSMHGVCPRRVGPGSPPVSMSRRMPMSSAAEAVHMPAIVCSVGLTVAVSTSGPSTRRRRRPGGSPAAAQESGSSRSCGADLSTATMELVSRGSPVSTNRGSVCPVALRRAPVPVSECDRPVRPITGEAPPTDLPGSSHRTPRRRRPPTPA
jgi:hypothetical protein